MEPSNGEIDETQKVESQEEKREVKTLVESSNGESKETQKVEYQAEDKEVVVQDVGDVEAVVESVREIVLDGGDLGLISSSFDKEETPNEKSSGMVESRELEEKEVSSSVVDFEPVVVSLSKDFVQGVEELVENSIGLEPKERKEKASLSTKDNNVVSKGIEETTLPTVDENGGVPVVVTEEIEETKFISCNASVGEASKENVKNLLPPFPVVDTNIAVEERNKTEIPESAANPHVISVPQRTLQPTSWRSCCGLFEVLHRSDRYIT